MNTPSMPLINDCEQEIFQFENLKSILASTDMGIWNLFIEEKKNRYRLQPNAKMKEIIGIPADSNMSEEEMCALLISRIHPSDKVKFDKYNESLINGNRAECTYRWNHPTLGLRYMRCGGIAVSTNNDVLHLNGYHYDVTEQVIKENRADHIIKSFARTYEFINYINMDDGSFFTYTDKEITDESIKKVLAADNATTAINIGLKEIVADEYKKEITSFSDLTTMNERMSHSNVLVSEFRDVNGIWFESTFSVAERKIDGSIKNLVWTVRHIDNEKQIELRKQKLLEDNIAANKAKTRFIQNMSHEIRTPLNAIYGFAQLLGQPDGTWTADEKKMYNSYIYKNYKMLEMLINDVIDIANSEQGGYRVDITSVILKDVCENAIIAMETRVPEGVKMYFTSDFPDDYMITSDGRRIQQILFNYLSNACKNTQEGEIHLHCSKTENPGKITFSVTDTGIGVPKDKASVIFDRFTKLDDCMQGSGLGLHICLTIANKLGGEVYLDTSYTDGARFVFVIDDKQD